MLLVEQQVRNALEVADRAYVLSGGRVVLDGTSAELKDRLDEIEGSYLAAAELVAESSSHGSASIEQ